MRAVFAWGRTLPIFLLLALALGVAACSSEEPQQQETEETSQAPASDRLENIPALPPPSRSAEEVGEAVAQIYLNAIAELVVLTQGTPPVEEIAPQVDNLRQETITALVQWGEKREELDTRGKETCDRLIQLAFTHIPEQDLAALQNAQTAYRGDAELSSAFEDMYFITRYAIFELLREQAPMEADRLGIH
ncbi:MAG: hypothetical protein D6E12_04275 [Desulfovibrio sp.]|nr:MAG: hypothetical protein D6E12_04275 [Desulfovibrio sp.]